MEAPALVIEADYRDLGRDSRKHTAGGRGVHPNAVVGSLTAWCVRHHLPVLFAGDWHGGQELTYSFLRHFWRFHGSARSDASGILRVDHARVANLIIRGSGPTNSLVY